MEDNSLDPQGNFEVKRWTRLLVAAVLYLQIIFFFCKTEAYYAESV